MKNALFILLLIFSGKEAFPQGNIHLVNHSTTCTIDVYMYGYSTSAG